jgi:hypothetical protein
MPAYDRAGYAETFSFPTNRSAISRPDLCGCPRSDAYLLRSLRERRDDSRRLDESVARALADVYNTRCEESSRCLSFGYAPSFAYKCG